MTLIIIANLLIRTLVEDGRFQMMPCSYELVLMDKRLLNENTPLAASTLQTLQAVKVSFM